MNLITRRKFIKTTSLAGIALTAAPFNFKKNDPLLSFSSIGCPDWSFQKILDFGAANNYDGIELRGIKRELDLTKVPEFSKENIQSTLQQIKSKNLKIVNLGSSAAMHFPHGAEREKNLNEAKNFIQLAQQLSCPFVRVFPNVFPGEDKAATINNIVTALQELGNYAKGTGVTIVMETHGGLVKSEEIANIMQMVNHPGVGLVWDVINMWAVSKEPPAEVYGRLKKYIQHTHIKDLTYVNGKEEYVLLGKGVSPIFDAIDLLRKNNYKGYYSFEWEKLWHPEIEEPEVAIAYYPKAMKEHFKK